MPCQCFLGASMNRALYPWLFWLSSSEKSKGDQHCSLSLIGTSLTAHCQKQRTKCGVRKSPAVSGVAIFLFPLYSFLKQEGEWSTTFYTKLKDNIYTKAEGNTSFLVLTSQAIDWKPTLPCCRLRVGYSLAFLQVVPMFPTVKKPLFFVVSLHPDNSPFIFEDKKIKAQSVSTVKAIKSEWDSKLNQSFFTSHGSLFPSREGTKGKVPSACQLNPKFWLWHFSGS